MSPEGVHWHNVKLYHLCVFSFRLYRTYYLHTCTIYRSSFIVQSKHANRIFQCVLLQYVQYFPFLDLRVTVVSDSRWSLKNASPGSDWPGPCPHKFHQLYGNEVPSCSPSSYMLTLCYGQYFHFFYWSLNIVRYKPVWPCAFERSCLYAGRNSAE